jgi:hypothetical protein
MYRALNCALLYLLFIPTFHGVNNDTVNKTIMEFHFFTGLNVPIINSSKFLGNAILLHAK